MAIVCGDKYHGGHRADRSRHGGRKVDRVATGRMWERSGPDPSRDGRANRYRHIGDRRHAGRTIAGRSKYALPIRDEQNGEGHADPPHLLDRAGPVRPLLVRLLVGGLRVLVRLLALLLRRRRVRLRLVVLPLLVVMRRLQVVVRGRRVVRRRLVVALVGRVRARRGHGGPTFRRLARRPLRHGPESGAAGDARPLSGRLPLAHEEAVTVR